MQAAPALPLRERLSRLARPRRPEALPLRIDRRRIYILPTGFGLFLGVLLLVMLVGALNYNNNPALLLGLLLAAGVHNSFVRAHFNLSGLRVLGVHAEPVHAGQPLQLRMEFEAEGRRQRAGLRLHGPLRDADFAMAPGSRTEVVLGLPTERRGWLPPPRLRLSTHYPHGLARAWTWIWPERGLLVYPAPESDAPPLPEGMGDAGRPRAWSQGEEPHQLRDYRPGDPLRQVAWKASARRGSLLVREYEASTRRDYLLDWSDLTGVPHEIRISRLTRWVIEAERLGARYALSLPGGKIGPGRGLDHRHACLRALALMPHA